MDALTFSPVRFVVHESLRQIEVVRFAVSQKQEPRRKDQEINVLLCEAADL